MRTLALFLMASVGLGMTTLPAGAGVFVYPIRSTQISADPPRYRTVIGIFDRYFLPIYGVRANPLLEADGSPATPILEASGPQWAHVAFDAGGWPTWFADSQPHTNWNDSLLVVTASPVSCVSLSYLVPPEGGTINTHDLCLTTDQLTPARSATWGRLKILYR
jgi:hypothetical protein